MRRIMAASSAKRTGMRDRRLLTLNEEAIKADARRYRDKVAKSVGMKTLPEE